MDITANTTTHGKVDSVDFAIYLEHKARELGKAVNVTKIQKWLYICYGIYLAVYEEQLLKERPKAWDFGPAFPSVHRKQKQKENNDSLINLLSKITPDDFKEYDDVIEATLRTFGDWTAQQLVNWTHMPGTAWHNKIMMNEKYSALDNFDIISDFKEIVVSKE